MKTVGIIGASGFIGSLITKKFLQEGFKVKVSACEMAKMDKYNHFDDLPESTHLTVVSLLVRNKRALKEFVSDCNILVHGGTPFQVDLRVTFMPMPKIVEMETLKYFNIISAISHLESVILVESVKPFITRFSMPWDDGGFKFSFNENNMQFVHAASNIHPGLKFERNRAIERFMNARPKLDFKIYSIAPYLDNSKAADNQPVGTDLHFLIKQHKAISYSYIQNQAW